MDNTLLEALQHMTEIHYAHFKSFMEMTGGNVNLSCTLAGGLTGELLRAQQPVANPMLDAMNKRKDFKVLEMKPHEPTPCTTEQDAVTAEDSEITSTN